MMLVTESPAPTRVPMPLAKATTQGCPYHRIGRLSHRSWAGTAGRRLAVNRNEGVGDFAGLTRSAAGGRVTTCAI